MEICSKENGMVNFQDVKGGEVFIFEGRLYIKESCKALILTDVANSVRLDDGVRSIFYGNEKVKAVKAKVLIEG